MLTAFFAPPELDLEDLQLDSLAAQAAANARLVEAAQTGDEVLYQQAKEEVLGLHASLSAWSAADERPITPTEAPVACRCAQPSDRRCLGCGTRWCGGCALSGGASCPRCRGPVWGDEEPLPPRRRNPKMKGY